jgi:flavin reductase (DIM6/NTAB) family NADH-FMN oxidoreductase RutF
MSAATSTAADTIDIDTVELAGKSRLGSEYVEAMTGLAGGVTIVTTLDGHGRPAGLTTTSTVSVSADPPMMSVSMSTAGRTLAAVRSSGGFCVNILRSSGRTAAQVFASRSDDKFSNIVWEPGPRGLPWLPPVSSHALHCDVVAVVLAGDHAVVLGRVYAVSTGGPPAEGEDGLVYWRRSWRELDQRASRFAVVARDPGRSR